MTNRHRNLAPKEAPWVYRPMSQGSYLYIKISFSKGSYFKQTA